MNLIEKILYESDISKNNYVFPSTVKKLKGVTDISWKDINVNSIFKNKFIQKYRNKWQKYEENYYEKRLNKTYGGFFHKTGTIKTTVNINDIYPGQTGIDGDALKCILSDEENNHKQSSELPEALKLYDQGKIIILLIDGHHRVAADILKGKQEVELMLKVDKFT